jgi:hypothetical protein
MKLDKKEKRLIGWGILRRYILILVFFENMFFVILGVMGMEG